MDENGCTVQELYERLKRAVDAGQGQRNVLIGPTREGKDGQSRGLACPVVGVEMNDNYEVTEFWLHPGDDIWWSPADEPDDDDNWLDD